MKPGFQGRRLRSGRIEPRLLWQTCLVCGLVAATFASAQDLMPQDGYYVSRIIGQFPAGDGTAFSPFNSVEVAPDGRVILVVENSAPMVLLDADLNVIRQFGTDIPPSEVGTEFKDAVFSEDGNVYVTDFDSPLIRIHVFDGNLDYVQTIVPAAGGSASWIDELSDGTLVILDPNNNAGHIRVFDKSGVLIREFGDQGPAPFQLENPRNLAASGRGLIAVNDRTTAGGSESLKVFSESGEEIAVIPSSVSNHDSLDWLGGEWIIEGDNGSLNFFAERLLDTAMGRTRHLEISFMIPVVVFGSSWRNTRAAYADNGDIVIGGSVDGFGWGVFRMTRTFRAPKAAVDDGLPIPKVVSQSSTGPVLTLDYLIQDSDSPTVSAYPLAFLDDGISLGSVLVPASSSSGTGGIGVAVPSNTLHTLTWDVSVDLATMEDFVDLSVEILSQDDRASFLDYKFLVIPADVPNPGDPELIINASPVADSELLSAWYWLIASGDPEIQFSNGEVVAAAGPLMGQLLASGTTTTVEGRQFLLDRMMVREATAQEVQRAKEATTPGVINAFTPRNPVLEDSSRPTRPDAVNEFGFDTQASGFWVVPLFPIP